MVPVGQSAHKSKSKNPFDSMTKTQSVRQRFKSSLPRKAENREMSAMEAMAKTMELFDALRNDMGAAGLDRNDAHTALVYHQPKTKGQEAVLARVIPLPDEKDIQTFVKQVMALDKPRFLGLLFLQRDPDTEKTEQQNVIFIWPFLNGPDDAARLIAARNQQQMGGLKKIVN